MSRADGAMMGIVEQQDEPSTVATVLTDAGDGSGRSTRARGDVGGVQRRGQVEASAGSQNLLSAEQGRRGEMLRSSFLAMFRTPGSEGSSRFAARELRIVCPRPVGSLVMPEENGYCRLVQSGASGWQNRTNRDDASPERLGRVD